MLRRILLSILLLAAPAALRADGVTDFVVNPATGYTISKSGSYRLSGDATMTANVAGVTITASNVTLDLNGHTLTGGAGSTTDGISTDQIGITILNGAVKSFGGGGINALFRTVVRDLRITGCNIAGNHAALSVGDQSTVERCLISDNSPASGGTSGISAGLHCHITGNTVMNNVSPNNSIAGILTQGDSTITDNVVSGNSGYASVDCTALYAGPHSVVRGNVVTGNRNTWSGNITGIAANTGSIIEHNTCQDQTTGTTGSGTAAGISAYGSIVIGNVCQGNGAGAGSNGRGVGIELSNGGVAQDNDCIGNTGQGTGRANGITASSTCRVVNNHCAGNTGGVMSHGIRVSGTGNYIAGNTTTGHTHGGIIFTNATSNRCEANRCDETEVIESTAASPFFAVAPASLGAGDLANVLY